MTHRLQNTTNCLPTLEEDHLCESMFTSEVPITPEQGVTG